MIPFPFQFGGFGNSFLSSDGDPNYANVSLLLHCDGTNGSTTFTDNSSSAKTVTSNGGAQISTTQSKFGGASGYFDGANDYLSIADSADFDFGSGDFTIEFFFFMPTGQMGDRVLLTKQSVFSPFHFYVSGNIFTFYGSTSGTGWDFADKRIADTYTRDIFHHVAVTRSGTTFRTFYDGTVVTTWTSSSALMSNSTNVTVGSAGGSSFCQGYVDELRITKGVARYTANFTPPAAPFPNS